MLTRDQKTVVTMIILVIATVIITLLAVQAIPYNQGIVLLIGVLIVTKLIVKYLS